jgi:hypothetical protein
MAFSQVFPEEEFLDVVRTVDGSVLKGVIVSDRPDETDRPVSLEIYGGTTFVIIPENIQSISEVRNPDYGRSVPPLELNDIVQVDENTYAVRSETDGAKDGRFRHRLTSDESRRIVFVPEVQIAGGTVAVGGYNIGLFRRRLQLSVLAGLGWAFGPKLVAAQRLTWTIIDRQVVPRISLYATEASDFSRIAVAAGPSIGVEFRMNRRISSIIWDNAFVMNINPDESGYIVFSPSLGVTF